MKVQVITVMVSIVAIASAALALSWISLFEAAGTVAIGLLVVLALTRLRESVKVASDDEGQRHHRGRGGGGLM